MTASNAANGARPLMRMVAAGLPVTEPWSDDGRFLTITGLDDIRCQVTLSDNGDVLAEWWPAADGHADPVMIAALIMKILDQDRQGWRPDCGRYPGLTLKGTVGRPLQDAGLDVGMAVYDDPHNYEIFAEIIVTSPQDDGRGKVRFNDDGMLTWEWKRPAGADTGEVAKRIISVMSDIISAGKNHE